MIEGDPGYIICGVKLGGEKLKPFGADVSELINCPR